MKSFKELGLNENIINGLNKQGIETPTEIQSLSISDILDGMDVIGEAHTGSGKTLAFLAPIFQKIDETKREMQVLNQIKLLSTNSEKAVTSLNIIGDVNIDKQIKKLKEVKPHIIVGTPGRVLDLMNKKKIASHQIKTIVIDEGDNLLDNTSSNFVKDIVKKTMRDRQLLIFSATISNKTLSTAKELMKDPIIYKNKQQVSLNPNIEHYYIEVDQREKVEVLRKLLSAVNPEKALVFVNKSFDINIVKDKLNYHNKSAFAMHNRLTKEERQNALESFRNGKINFF